MHLFDTGIVEASLDLADGGVRVVVSGLDEDFRRLPLGVMPEAIVDQ